MGSETKSPPLLLERRPPSVRRIAQLAEQSLLAAAQRWFTRERSWINDIHLQLCRIPAATFFEQERAEWLRARFSGSIVKNGMAVSFVLQEAGKTLNVVYSGSDPLPDTFKDNSKALADGRLGTDGIFQANKIQAKCASKYEAKPNPRDVSHQPVPAARAS